MSDDICMNIIFRWPLIFVVHCKLLSKNFNGTISHIEFSKTLFQRHKVTLIQLIYWVGMGYNSHNSQRSHLTLSLNKWRYYVFGAVILGSCNGLILFEPEWIMCYCVFNPFTSERQLIPYLNSLTNELEKNVLVVDYPNVDQ